MKIGVIIPDRGDRPEFTKQCLKMISAQLRKPDLLLHVNYAPESNSPDLTQRVRRGFEQAKEQGCNVVLIIENDDYYHPDYIGFMIMNWLAEGCPEVFGIEQSVYYHIGKREYSRIDHSGRASLMNTLIRTDAKIEWPDDSEVFLDLNLWKQLQGQTIKTSQTISIGIKHGIGLCGGSGHTTMRYEHTDAQMHWLKKCTGEDFKFYSKQARTLKGS